MTTANTYHLVTDYMAPEQVTQCGHGKDVDFWGMGVLLYEMLTGEHLPSAPASMKLMLQGYHHIMTPQVMYTVFFTKSDTSDISFLLGSHTLDAC